VFHLFSTSKAAKKGGASRVEDHATLNIRKIAYRYHHRALLLEVFGPS